MYLKTVDDRFNVRPLIIIKITEASVESNFWLKVWIQLVWTTKKSKDSGHTNEKTNIISFWEHSFALSRILLFLHFVAKILDVLEDVW